MTGCSAEQLATLVQSVGAASADIICNQLQLPHDGAAAGGGLLEGGLRRAMAASSSSPDLSSELDILYMLFSAYLVFIMQAGFAMLCAGAVRSKNTVNILLKNVMDACGGAISYWLIGYGFAYGVCGKHHTSNGFIGCGQFALSMNFSDFHPFSFWLFQWAFAAAASTITVGSLAERTHFVAYLTFSVFLTAWVYPLVSHWVWSEFGWMSAFKASGRLLQTGVLDFAGCGVVHMVGGWAGLAGAVMVGPRIGRFDAQGRPVPLPGHSATLLCLGTFLLWFGWYGFNPGSMLTISTPNAAATVARTAVTTTLAAAGGGLAQLLLSWVQTAQWDMINVCNGLLSGLVSITASAPIVEPWAAVLIGALGGVIFNYGGKLLVRLRIDDPLEAVNMHAFCGAWGLFAVGWLAKPAYVSMTYGADVASVAKGIFYGGNGKLFGAQIIGIIVISAWTLVHMFALFAFLKYIGRLRVSQQEEFIGLDVSMHGGSAYPMDASDSAKEAMRKYRERGANGNGNPNYATAAPAANNNVDLIATETPQI